MNDYLLLIYRPGLLQQFTYFIIHLYICTFTLFMIHIFYTVYVIIYDPYILHCVRNNMKYVNLLRQKHIFKQMLVQLLPVDSYISTRHKNFKIITFSNIKAVT